MSMGQSIMVNASWLIDKRVILLKPEGEVTEEAIHANFLRVQEMRAEGIQPTYLIIDSTEQTGHLTPATAQKLAQGVREHLAREDGTVSRLTILVTKNMVVRFVMSLLVQWLGSSIRAFDTVTEAVEYLYARDTSLPKIEQLNQQKSL
jgi:hypothetical protein